MKQFSPRIGILFVVALLGACAGMNPNPGERTADTNWERGNYARAFEVARSAAEGGAPWAQLRMGMYYEAGFGVPVDIKEAIRWYQKAAVQMGEGKWAEGYIVGATGRAGYFGQQNDALIARFRLAHIYFDEGQGTQPDLVKAYLLIKNVSEVTNGQNVFFCCDWSGSRWFTADMIASTKSSIEQAMTTRQKEEALQRADTWAIETGL